jgi:hypothetical protein
MTLRSKGSVPNVRRALREGEASRAKIQAKVRAMSRGTEGSRQKTLNRQRGLRGPGNQ